MNGALGSWNILKQSSLYIRVVIQSILNFALPKIVVQKDNISNLNMIL